MRRDDICLYVSPANRSRLEAISKDRNSSSKAVWRAEIVLVTADGLGTNAIMKRTGKSKPCVWRWQERYIEAGVEGLLRDKTRPPGTKPLSAAIKRKVLAKTASQTPPAATHWSVRTMAVATGISHTSVQRIWAEAGLNAPTPKCPDGQTWDHTSGMDAYDTPSSDLEVGQYALQPNGTFIVHYAAETYTGATSTSDWPDRIVSHPMSEFHYSAPAELFAAQGRSGLRYRRFSRAADAIRYAVEKLPPAALSSARLEVEQKRYDANAIRALYDNANFPPA